MDRLERQVEADHRTQNRIQVAFQPLGCKHGRQKSLGLVEENLGLNLDLEERTVAGLEEEDMPGKTDHWDLVEVEHQKKLQT